MVNILWKYLHGSMSSLNFGAMKWHNILRNASVNQVDVTLNMHSHYKIFNEALQNVTVSIAVTI